MEKGIALFCGNDIPRDWIFGPVAHIAGSGQTVVIVDGENSFRSYLVARYARAQGLDARTALARVQVSRAFTAYQLTELVTTKLSLFLETAPHRDIPRCGAIVCLGLLGTLYDEDLPPSEAHRLLKNITAQLKHLAQHLPIVITVRPPPREAPGRIALARALVRQADFVYMLEPGSSLLAPALPAQLSLWPAVPRPSAK